MRAWARPIGVAHFKEYGRPLLLFVNEIGYGYNGVCLVISSEVKHAKDKPFKQNEGLADII